MKLILFRHGLAMERDEAFKNKIDDSMRPLVEKGKERSKKMAKFLKEHDEDFQVLVSSPVLRAKQTAEILREIIPFGQYLESSELVPEAPPHAFAKWVQAKILRATSVVAVGHDPQLSVLASWLLAGENESFIDLKKSGVICLEVESFDQLSPKCATLKWALAPKLI